MYLIDLSIQITFRPHIFLLLLNLKVQAFSRDFVDILSSNSLNSHSINQSDLICRYRGRMHEFKSSTPMYLIFVPNRKRIPNAGVLLGNKMFECHPDNRRAHSGIYGRWQTTCVYATHRVKLFLGSPLKCIMQMN